MTTSRVTSSEATTAAVPAEQYITTTLPPYLLKSTATTAYAG